MITEEKVQWAMGWLEGYMAQGRQRQGGRGLWDYADDAVDYHGKTPCIPPQVLAPMIDRIYLRADAQAALADEMNPSKP